MLVLVTSLVLGTGAWADQAQDRAAKVAALYQQGVNALKSGDVQLARESFTTVLRIQPNHGNARYQLLRLKNDGGRYKKLVRQKKLTQINIPAVNFDGVSLPEAIEGLDILIAKESEGKFAPNFIIQDPNKLFESRPITIKLGNVPANVVLEYIMRMANASARYDEHAIVIRPLGGGAAKPETPKEESDDDRIVPFGE